MTQWFTNRWLLIFQWSVMAMLGGFAFYNSATDHGWQMAFNCFCIGFLFTTMLLRPLIEKRHKIMDDMLTDMNAAREKFERAVEEGRIEVVVLEAPRDGGAQHTVH